MESWLSYNLICIPLTKNNKLVGKEYLCDFRNSRRGRNEEFKSSDHFNQAFRIIK